jgi:hypothetical protein
MLGHCGWHVEIAKPIGRSQTEYLFYVYILQDSSGTILWNYVQTKFKF